MNPKFERQARLKEVGSQGQDRLNRARVVLSPASCCNVSGYPESGPERPQAVHRDGLLRPGIAAESRADTKVVSEDVSVNLELWLAKEYLERAGLTEVVVGRASGLAGEFVPPSSEESAFSYRVEALVPFAHAGGFETEVARTLAAGAWRALRQVRALLEVEA